MNENKIAIFQGKHIRKVLHNDWIDKRMRGIAVRKSLTDEWNNRGAQTDLEYAILTNEISVGSDAGILLWPKGNKNTTR